MFPLPRVSATAPFPSFVRVPAATVPFVVRASHVAVPSVVRAPATTVVPSAERSSAIDAGPAFVSATVVSSRAPATAAISQHSDRRQWDPGIGNDVVDWELISPPKNLIHEQLLKVCNSSFGRNEQDDECGYYAREIKSTVKSGLWVTKNLKDARTSNPSPPSKKLKKWNRIGIQKLFTGFIYLVCDFSVCCCFCLFVGLFEVSLESVVVLELSLS